MTKHWSDPNTGEALTTLRRTGPIVRPDPGRVLVRPFRPGQEKRIIRILSRVLSLKENEVKQTVKQVLHEFADRHEDIKKFLLRQYDIVSPNLPSDKPISSDRRLLIGAYFTQEYSLECAALFNPSIVPHPDQNNLLKGEVRCVVSFRATGEGHISSIVFREAIVDDAGKIKITPPSRWVSESEIEPNPHYHKSLFRRTLKELDIDDDFTQRVFSKIDEAFTLSELKNAVQQIAREIGGKRVHESESAILSLANSNYQLRFPAHKPLSERALFPVSSTQTNGIEDARFVCFKEDDGSQTYYATVSAYDGKLVIPELLETRDFLKFRFISLNGSAVQNKGMALFPRKIQGSYVMLSRQDNENNYIMFSDNLHFWYQHEILARPSFPWEFVQLGNCGSPIETDQGWLVLSHGVGPMRKYCIGAYLLDLENPRKVLGRTRVPLLSPDPNEREGYVPNVVYTCGGMVHAGNLILPYAMSDYCSNFAVVPLKDVLGLLD